MQIRPILQYHIYISNRFLSDHFLFDRKFKFVKTQPGQFLFEMVSRHAHVDKCAQHHISAEARSAVDV